LAIKDFGYQILFLAIKFYFWLSNFILAIKFHFWLSNLILAIKFDFGYQV